MTSAPHRSPATRSGPDPFRHLAVVHRSVEELLETLAPLLRAAVTRGDLIWAAVNDATRDAIERRLGAASFGIVFGEPGQPYSYSAQTTAARRAARTNSSSPSARRRSSDPAAPRR